MGTYREWIEKRKKEWVGKRVRFGVSTYAVVDVDYNGFLLIDRKTKYNDTTAVSIHHVEEI